MKTIVLGAGALGSIVAGHLARNGQDVALIARGPRAKMLAHDGLTIRGLSEFNVKLPIVEDPGGLGECDVFILTAKTYDTESALAGVRDLKAGMALSVQNGVLKDNQLAAVFGREHTVGCIADFSGEVAEDGVVAFTRNLGLYLGEMPRGSSPRIEALAATLNDSGVKTVVSDQMQTVEWSKYVAWLGITAVAVLSRLYTHTVYRDVHLARLQATLLAEAAALAGKVKVDLIDLSPTLSPHTLATASFDEAVAHIQKAGEDMETQGVTTHRMSALQDLLRGRHLELEETYGYAVRLGAELGVPMPAIQTCYRLLAGINRAQS